MERHFVGKHGESIALIGSAFEQTTTFISENSFATVYGNINENSQKLLSHECREIT